MTAITPKKYLYTEPPAQLSGSLTIDLHNIAVQQLNAYRQARHAWLACAGDIHEKSQLRAVMEVAAADLAGFVNAAVQLELGEPDEWANA